MIETVKITPAGHTSRPCPHTPPSDNRLLQRCIEWMDGRIQWMRLHHHDVLAYESAAGTLAGLEVSAEEVHSLLLHPRIQRHEKYSMIGRFISAAYNTCVKEQAIILNIPVADIQSIGTCCEKLLISRSQPGFRYAEENKGVVISCCVPQPYDAAFGNLGVYLDVCGTERSPPIFSHGLNISSRPPTIFSYTGVNVDLKENTWHHNPRKARTVIDIIHEWPTMIRTRKRRIPDTFLRYVSELSLYAKHATVDEILQRYGEKPAEQITADLKERLGAKW